MRPHIDDDTEERLRVEALWNFADLAATRQFCCVKTFLGAGFQRHAMHLVQNSWLSTESGGYHHVAIFTVRMMISPGILGHAIFRRAFDCAVQVLGDIHIHAAAIFKSGILPNSHVGTTRSG